MSDIWNNDLISVVMALEDKEKQTELAKKCLDKMPSYLEPLEKMHRGKFFVEELSRADLTVFETLTFMTGCDNPKAG